MKHPLINFPATPNRRNWGRISDMSHDLYKEKMRRATCYLPLIKNIIKAQAHGPKLADPRTLAILIKVEAH
jgi:hypothetical protein